MADGLDLIHQYAETRDAEAFAAIVRRYQDLVYGVCLRIHGSPERAEDSAQECFLALAEEADRIRSSLAGWLHRSATHVSLRAIESQRARARPDTLHVAGTGY